MVNLQSREIILGEKKDSIERFEVWFHTPKGLKTTLVLAIIECQENDWPIDVIRAVAVAVGETFYEVL